MWVTYLGQLYSDSSNQIDYPSHGNPSRAKAASKSHYLQENPRKQINFQEYTAGPGILAHMESINAVN